MSKLVAESPDWGSTVAEGSPRSFSLGAACDAPACPLRSPRSSLSSIYEQRESYDAEDGAIGLEHVERLFDDVLDPSPDQRTKALETLLTVLWHSIPGCHDSNEPSGPDGAGGRDPGRLIATYLDKIIRWSCTAPFADIRDSLSEFLENLRAVPVHVDEEARVEVVSTFMTADEIIPVDVTAEDKRSVLEECFLAQGRISHLMRVMIIQPQYLTSFDRAITCLLRESGPLPLHWRSYIAIMASEVHSCGYMVSRLGIEFTDVGGDKEWLRGLKYAPAKLVQLAELNVVLARRPWLVSADHIATLSQGADAWSSAELTHALVLMATFHSLCSFCLGCGLGPELDFRDFRDRASDLRASPKDTRQDRMQTTEVGCSDTSRLVDRLRSGPIAIGEVFDAPIVDARGTAPEPEPEISQIDDDQSAYLTPSYRTCEWSMGCQSFELDYTDFDMHSKDLRPLNLADCSWEELGYSMVGRYLGDQAAKLIDEEFQAALFVTDSRVGYGTAEVDTSPYRRAIWYYTQRLWGLIHADYEYSEVNGMLAKGIKCYIKLVASRPEMVRLADFMRATGCEGGVQFRPTEVCHINVLTSEARKQAELLYGLAALNDYDRSK